MTTLWIIQSCRNLPLSEYIVMLQVTMFCYAVLMLSLAVMVRCESVRRRNEPTLKPGDLNQLKGPRISYTPPPDRSERYRYSARRRGLSQQG